MAPVSVQNASTDPTTIIVIPEPRLALRHTLETVPDQCERFLGHNALELVDDRRDRVFVADQAEDADGDE